MITDMNFRIRIFNFCTSNWTPYFLKYNKTTIDNLTLEARYSNPVDIHEPVHYSVDGESGYGLYTEFLLYVLPVADDGGESDIQPVSDFLVHESLGTERENLYLPAT